MKLDLGELTHIASVAGIDMYTAWGVSDDALLAYTKAIVERCAREAEETPQEYEEYTGQEAPWNYTCAAAIRSLMEDDK